MKPLSGIQLIEGHPKFHLNADRTLQGWSGSSSPFLNRGTSNKGTFLLTNRHGVRSVLKIFPHSVNTEIPTQFLKKLDGMRLQALQGGPQILDFGALNRADGSPLFFVQMECMFCDSQAINLKDIDPVSENLIIHLEDQGHQVLGKFGQLLARAFENHILPLDPDLYLSDSGEIRWIDGERWIEVSSIYSRSYEFADTFWTLLEYSKRVLHSRPDLWAQASKEFYGEFFQIIESSPKLRSDEKASLISQIFKGKAAKDFKTFSDARLISSTEVLDLFKEALDYFKHRKKQ